MADQTIAELAAELGIDLKSESFDAGKAAIQMLIGQLNLLALEAKLAATDVNKALATIGLGAGGSKGPAPQLQKTVDWVKRGILGFAGIEAIKGLKATIAHTFEAGAALGDLVDKSGVALVEMQELGYAAELNGVSMGALSNTLGKLNMTLDKAAKKGGDTAAAFKKAGIAIKDANGKARPAVDVLGDVADHLQSLDEDDRPGKAIELLGKHGKDLVPLLKNGSKGLEEFRQEARDLGLVLDQETVDGMDKVGKDTQRLEKAFEGLKTEAMTALLPAIQELTTSLLAWVKENRAEIVESLVGAFRGLLIVVKAVAVIFKILVRFGAFLVKAWKPLLVIIVSLGVAYVYLNRQAIIAGIRMKLAGLMAAEGWVVALAPILAIGAAIAALILLIQDLYVWLTDDEADTVMGRLFGKASDNSIVNGFKKVFGVVADIFDGIISAIKWVLDQVMKAADKIEGFIDWIAGNDKTETQKELEAAEMDLYGPLGKDNYIGKMFGNDIETSTDPEIVKKRERYKKALEQVELYDNGGIVTQGLAEMKIPAEPIGPVTSTARDTIAGSPEYNDNTVININGGDPEATRKVVQEEFDRKQRNLASSIGGGK